MRMVATKCCQRAHRLPWCASRCRGGTSVCACMHAYVAWRHKRLRAHAYVIRCCVMKRSRLRGGLENRGVPEEVAARQQQHMQNMDGPPGPPMPGYPPMHMFRGGAPEHALAAAAAQVLDTSLLRCPLLLGSLQVFLCLSHIWTWAHELLLDDVVTWVRRAGRQRHICARVWPA